VNLLWDCELLPLYQSLPIHKGINISACDKNNFRECVQHFKEQGHNSVRGKGEKQMVLPLLLTEFKGREIGGKIKIFIEKKLFYTFNKFEIYEPK
jgi:hypothetical protein